MISNATSPAATVDGSVTVLRPLSSGAGTSASTPDTRMLVMGEKSPAGCTSWNESNGSSAVNVTVEPTAPPNGVIQDVAGSPSVAAQPAALATPVSRAVASAPSMPSTSASTLSGARWSRRTVTSTSNERRSGTVISRTSAGSGSERHRSLGRVRSRVSTYDTGTVASAASAGGSTTSTVGSSPVSTSAKPTAESAGPSVGSGTTTLSMVIVTVLGPDVGSMSIRWPSAPSERSSSSTVSGRRSSTASVTSPMWRTAAAPGACCSVT